MRLVRSLPPPGPHKRYMGLQQNLETRFSHKIDATLRMDVPVRMVSAAERRGNNRFQRILRERHGQKGIGAVSLISEGRATVSHGKWYITFPDEVLVILVQMKSL